MGMKPHNFLQKFRAPHAGNILLCALILTMILAGIQLRHWAWRGTTSLRFEKDIVNGFFWGSESVLEGRKRAANPASRDSWASFFKGYFAIYDKVKEEAYEGEYHLDYPPLRLLVMSLWARHVLGQRPNADIGRPEYVKPLLLFNLLCETACAVAIFLLVRLWLEHSGEKTSSRWLRGIAPARRGLICGLSAAGAGWLEPSLILDAHAWPQWDVWIMPFYLFAALSTVNNRWLCCGCLLAAGSMFKGQLLMVTPFFVMWPLWEKQWGGALRVLAGFGAACAVIVSPWLLRNPAAWLGMAAVLTVTGGILIARKPRNAAVWFCGIFAVAAFFAGALWGGSFAWLQIGLLYGTQQYPYLIMGSCYNLAALLAHFQLSLKDVLWSHDFGSLHVAVTMQWLLRSIYLAALGLCALGAARHSRNRDPRLLIALATPWLLMFALLGQMHERYLMWGAIASAVALGVSARLSVVHFVFSVASTSMIVHVMLIDKKIGTTLALIQFFDRITPYASSLVLLCVALYLKESLFPGTFTPRFRKGNHRVPPVRAEDF